MAIDWQRTGWPPSDEDRTRLENYKQYEQCFVGDHHLAFQALSARVPEGMRRIIFDAVNLPGLISKTLADFLMGEAPGFKLSDAASAEQKALNKILLDNDFSTMLYEATLTSSFRGDIVFRPRIAPRRPGGVPELIIDEVPAYNYFVERDPDNVRSVLSESICWIRTDEQKRSYLRVETHYPGSIENYAYRFSLDTGKVGTRVPLSQIYGDAAPLDAEQTGVEDSLLVHIPNYRYGSQYFGMSDYRDLMSLFDAIDNRLSKIDRVLDRHSAPKLIGMPGMADKQGRVDPEKIEYIEAESEAYKYLPRYVTWDAQLLAAFNFLEKAIDLALMIAEISPTMVGLEKAGVRPDSTGVALRMRYLKTEGKVNRKKLYADRGIKKLLLLAMQLSAVHLNTPAPPGEPRIDWNDGLPQIYTEAITDEVNRVGAGLSSKQSAIERIDECTPEEALEELERIKEEQMAMPKPFDVFFGGDETGGNASAAAKVAAALADQKDKTSPPEPNPFGSGTTSFYDSMAT